MGQRDKGLESGQRAIELREHLVKANRTVASYLSDLATSYLNYGADLLGAAGDDSQKLEEGLAFREKALARFLDLTRLAPGNVDARHRLAGTHVAVSWGYRQSSRQPKQRLTTILADLWVTGFHDQAATPWILALHSYRLSKIGGGTKKAREHLIEARRIWAELVKQGKATATHRFYYATGESQLALMHLYANEFPQAIAIFQHANSVLGELLTRGYNPPACKFEISVNFANMAFCAQETGKFDDAFRYHMRVIDLREELVRESPQTPDYKDKLASARVVMSGRAEIYLQRTLPPMPTKTPADRLKHQQARLAALEKLVREYPRITDFKRNVVSCLIKIAALQAAPLAVKATKLTVEEQRQRQEHIDRTMATLRRAKANGLADTKALEREPAFAPLRDEPDFQRFIKDLK